MSALTVFGCRVIVDPTIPPDEVRLVSTEIDKLTGQVIAKDFVRMTNLRARATSPTKEKDAQ